MRSRLLGFYTSIADFIGLARITQRLRLSFSLIMLTLVATNAQAAQTIVVFGDSLSAAYGIQQNQGWVTLLQNKLKQEKFDYKVVNSSISGRNHQWRFGSI